MQQSSDSDPDARVTQSDLRGDLMRCLPQCVAAREDLPIARRQPLQGLDKVDLALLWWRCRRRPVVVKEEDKLAQASSSQ